MTAQPSSSPGLTRVGRSFCATVDGVIRGVASLGRHLPDARRRQRGVEVIRDLPYSIGGGAAQRLDVYRAVGQRPGRPALLYIHGGGFAVCSKDTHWSLAVDYVRLGFVVFNINYRLSTRHPFPAAINDAITALRWVQAQGHRFGADTRQLVIAGESAGGNLATALAVASSYRLEHGPARALFDTGLSPSAFIAACPVLQVSAVHRFWQDEALVSDRATQRILRGMQRAYIGLDASPGAFPLADPLLLLEGRAPDRALPPALTLSGDRDFLVADSRRLKRAMDALESPCELHVYPGEHHAFHALPWKESARRCWADQRAFLNQHVPHLQESP